MAFCSYTAIIPVFLILAGAFVIPIAAGIGIPYGIPAIIIVTIFTIRPNATASVGASTFASFIYRLERSAAAYFYRCGLGISV